SGKVSLLRSDPPIAFGRCQLDLVCRPRQVQGGVDAYQSGSVNSLIRNMENRASSSFSTAAAIQGSHLIGPDLDLRRGVGVEASQLGCCSGAFKVALCAGDLRAPTFVGG